MVFSFILILTVTTLFDHCWGEGVILTPPWSRTYKYENEKYAVKCEGGSDLVWRNPNDTIVLSNNPSALVHTTENGEDSGLHLIFEKIQKEHKGDYTCFGKISGKTYSESFYLGVIKPAVFQDPKQTVLEVLEGKNVTLTCVVDAEPLPDLTWYFQDKPTINTKPSALKSEYAIENISLEHSGTYICRAFQSILQTRNAEKRYKLTVLHKPVLMPGKKYRKMVYGFPNETANLTCQVLAEPKVYFIWYRHNRPVDPKKDAVTITTEDNISVMMVPMSGAQNYGEYYCEATNPLGQLTQLFVLNETVRPRAPEKLVISEVFPTAAVFAVKSAKYASWYRAQYTEYTYCSYEEKWRKADLTDCEIKDKSKNMTYCRIGHLQYYTKYVLRVASVNEGGASNYSKEIIFRTPTLPSSSLSAINSDATFLIFLCFLYSARDNVTF